MSFLILASASPRRAELLRAARMGFEVQSVAIDESSRSGENGIILVERLAQAKAAACLRKNPQTVVLAADTVVLHRNKFFGKPTDYGKYVAMMKEFSDASHEVASGVCVKSSARQTVFHCVTTVTFGVLSSAWIKAYWDSGEPKDKAGGYAIQGYAGSQIREISGSYTNVVGLPLYETCVALAKFGICSAWAE